MNAEQSLKLARRFIELPLEKRRLFLDGLRAENIDFSRFAIPAGVEVEDRLALSYAQQRMWFLWQLEPQSAAYNLPSAVRLDGRLDDAALVRAFEWLLERHQALRTVFRQHGDLPRQVILPVDLDLVREDFSELDAVGQQARVEAAIQAEARAPFDLQDGPLLRVKLLRLGEQAHVLLLTLHHIVADGWSMNVLIEEFVHAYDAFCAATQPTLAPLAIQYADYALWQRRWLEAGEQERQLDYWRAKLGDAHPVLQLPVDHPRLPGGSRQGQRLDIAIEPALAERLGALARQQNVTLFAVLLAGFKLLLQRYSGQQDIRVGVPIANRNREESEGLIGLFVNTQVLRSELDPTQSVEQLLSALRETTRDAQAHQDLPFERLVEGLQVERSLHHTPLFQVLYNHQASVAEVGALRSRSGLALQPLGRGERTVQFELTLDTLERGGELSAAFTYASALFEPATIERMAGHWKNLLQAMTREPRAAIGELPMLTDAELQQARADSQGPLAAFAASDVLALFAAQVQRDPEAPALVFAEQSLSYAQLDQRTNALARRLLEQGVGPDSAVGIAVERSLEMVIGVLGILKAGGAYVPLDPDYPAQRLAYMAEDSGIRWLVTQEKLLANLPTLAGVTPLLFESLDALDVDADRPLPGVEPQHLAYSIYTSGSTGQAKGVGISHGALANYVQALLQRLALDDVRSMAVVSTIAADLGHTTLFGALCSGACLHVIGLDVSLDGARFAEYMSGHGIEMLKIVPSHLEALLGAEDEGGALPRRCLVLGGEACAPGLIERIQRAAPQCRVFNHYGPTETTVGALMQAVDQPHATVPLGTPLANVCATVLDEALQVVPAGTAGELYLGGAGLGRGYHRRAALTAERFIPDPLGTAGQRLYRTGDSTRRRLGGQIEYLGRIDQQIKIRGYRIELGEITAALKQCPQVREATVQVVGASQQVVAYLVLVDAAQEQQVSTLLREQLAAVLPDVMCPTHYVMLDRLPLTLNGKLDLRALPLPGLAATSQAYRAPATELEQQLGEIWQQVLKVERVGLDDNFFALGGHSLLATQIISRVRRVLAVDTALRCLFETASLEQFAREVQSAATGPAPVQIRRLDRDLPLAVSHAQQRQWLFWQLEPESTAYHTPIVVRLQGQLDLVALERTFAALAARHEALRTTFVEQAGQLTQRIAPTLDAVLEHERLAPGTPRDAIEARVLAETQRLFDLAQGPLWRARLMEVEAHDHLLVVTLHHIISDGGSMSVLAREFVQLYGAFKAGREPVLPVLPVQYADYAGWHRDWLEQGEMQRQLGYWREQLGDEHPLLELPTTHSRQALRSHRLGRVGMRLEAGLERDLRQLARAHELTLFQVFLAAFALLLQRYTDQSDIRIGIPVTNRNRLELEGVLGFFVNTLVMRVPLAPQLKADALLRQVKATVLGAQSHQDLPFDRLVEALNPPRTPGQNPLFQVMYNHLSIAGENVGGRSLPGLAAREMILEGGTAQFDLTLETLETNDGIQVSLLYAAELFDAPAMARMARHWQQLLRALVAQTQQPIAVLSMLDAGEQAQTLADWPSGALPPEAHARPVHQLIAERAQLTPQAVAVIVGEQSLSYAELDHQANRLAHSLIARGVGPEVLVAIALERSVEMLVGLLAILKAGGAFVPLDPEYPQERLAYMLRDSGVALLLTQTRLLGSLPVVEGVDTLLLDSLRDVPGLDSEPVVALHAGNLAYVIYTSGSTGQPKGVSVAHGPLAMHCLATGQSYEMSAADCELHFLSFAFDGAHERWLTTLIHGGRLLLRDDELWSPERTYEEIRRHGVTMAGFPPVYLQQLAEHAQRVGNPPPVRLYSFGGDAMPRASFELVQQALRPQLMINGYGPTETVVTPMVWKTRAADRCTSAYAPIGECVGERRACVLDAGLGLLPAGLPGELYLGGEGLARGYLHRAAMTAERFVPDPFSEQGARLYRTGDQVCQRTDGVFDYLGRIDNQVKIRGFRVELGEIEARLRAQASIREAVVLAKDGPSGKQLVAYVVSAVPVDGNGAALRETLKACLGEKLPDYMVPVHWLFLAQLPVTANGKLDRQALPAPDASLLQQHYSAPQNALEQQLAMIWQDVLKLARVGIDDNFFELGGDSIISIQVVSRARQAGVHFTPKDLFQHQTVRGLASVASQGAARIQADQGPVSGVLPLLAIQQLFFAESIAQRHHWNQSVLLQPLQALDPERLEASLRALVEHHDGLRLSFSEGAEGWTGEYRGLAQQRQAWAQAPILWQVQLESPADIEALANQAQRSLSLADGPLLRAVLISLGDGTQRLLLVVHHLVVDGVSWRILLEDLQMAYNPLASGTASFPAKSHSAQAWAERLQDYARSAPVRQELAYWQAQLQGGADLPCRDAQGRREQRDAVTVHSRLSASLTHQLLREAPAAYRTRVNDLLLAALARVVSRWSGAPDVLVQLEGHGREGLFEDLDLNRTVGWFTSVFPVRLSPASSLSTTLKQIKEQLRAVPHHGIGFGLLRYMGAASSRETLAALTPPRITFNYLGQFDGSFDQQDALFVPATEPKGADHDACAPLGNWLSLNGQVYGGELSMGWTFSRAMFDPAVIERLADDYARELQALIEHCCTEGVGGVTPTDFPLARLSQPQLDALPIAAEAIDDLYPLSPMQQGMLFHSLYEPEGGHYINQLRVDIAGLDVERFIDAWQAAVDSHDILRTGYVWQGELEQPVQVVLRQARLACRMLDWRSEPALDTALQALADADHQQGFDLLVAPLLRLTLVRTAADTHHLICTNHHVLMDGWSSSRLLAEVLLRYNGVQPERPLSRYRDYIAWLQAQDAQQAEGFWRARLAGVEEPTLLARAMARVKAGSVLSGHAEWGAALDAGRTRQLVEFARQQKITLNSLVQAAWSLLLQRYSGLEAVMFGATVSGRPPELPGVEQQLGLFINTLPVIATPCPQIPVADWLQQMQADSQALTEHGHTPLYDIQRWADLGSQPLFDSLLVFENYPVSQVLSEGTGPQLQFSHLNNHEQTNYPLTLAVSLGEELLLHYGYDQGHFNEPQVRQLQADLLDLLQQLVSAPGARSLGELTLSSALAIPAAAPTVVDGESLARLIERQALKTPHAIALIADDQQLTYGELNRQANRLAHRLIEWGVGPQVLVGIGVERGLQMAVGLLAIFKAGAGYLPLDPAYPTERLLDMLDDSGVELLLGQPALLDQLPATGRVRAVDLALACTQLDDCLDSAPPLDWAPQELAYVIYTSGSSGRPKGVVVSHGALAMHCQAAAACYGLQASDTLLQFASISFDAAAEQLFMPLIRGARVVLGEVGQWSIEQLLARIAECRISLLDLPPSYLAQVAEYLEGSGQRLSVKTCILGGEAWHPRTFERLDALQIGQLFNAYGPTEAVISPLIWPVESGVTQDYAPIGRAVGARTAYCLDTQFNPLPAGVAGELLMGGEGLARGYLNRPAMTAERFVPDPFSTGGQRLYRSGDRVSQREDGLFDFLGRIDSQVKIRGLRVELGEIESALLGLAAVREAVVLAREGASGKQLVAYVVASDGARDCAPTALKAALQLQLPDYMVPAHLLLLDSLPLTVNGKLDRRALPEPQAGSSTSFVAPQTAFEVQIAAIWQDVLKREAVSVTDNFFELGGDSIISIQVVSRARQVGVYFTPKELFQHQTVQALAAVARCGAQGLQIDQGAVTGTMPLLPIQQQFFDTAIPQRHHWNQSVLLKPAQALRAEWLEQALGALVIHHDALRLGFGEGADGWSAEHRGLWHETSLWCAPAADAAELQRLCEQAQQSLNLQDGPLLRAALFTLADGSQRLLLVIHHLVVDGVSWRVLFEDLQTAYGQLAQGGPVVLANKTSAYKSWAEQLHQHGRSDALRAESAYWLARLQGVEADLPDANPQASQQGQYGRTVFSALDQTLTRQLLQEAPAAYRTQVNDLLLAALVRVIGRWTERDDVLIQLEGHGREELFDHLDLSRTVGWFTSVFPVRLSAGPDQATTLKQVKEALRAVPNKGIGFGLLRYCADADLRAQMAELAQPRITFNYLGQFDGSFDAEDALFVPALDHKGAEQDSAAPLGNWLSLDGQVYGGELRMGWTFSREMFDPAVIEQLADEYRRELSALIAHCCQPDNRGVTPSDFPLANLTQAQLDSLPMAPGMIEDVYPLSPMQQGMLFHSLYEQQGGDYINQMCVDVQGLDVERFREAWQAAIDRHEILRTGFVWQGPLQQPVQVVLRQASLALMQLDWRSQADPAAALQALAREERQRGFALEQAPLLRLLIVQVADDRHHFICTNHHILMDGWSNAQFLGEILQRYAGQPLARQSGRYRDYIAWLQRQDGEASEAFWKAQLADLQMPTRLAASGAAPDAQNQGHGDHLVSLDLEQTRQLRACAQAHKVTVNTLVQAAWLVLLGRYTGQHTVAFGATVSGRPVELKGIEQQIGLFINTLPIIASPEPGLSVADWLGLIQGQNLSLREHEHTPLYDIQRWAGQGGEALFDSLLVFENYPVSQALETAPSGLRFGAISNLEQSNYPLSLAVGLDQQLGLQFGYARAAFSAERVAGMGRHLMQLLVQMAADPQRRLGDLQLLDDAEQATQLLGWDRMTAPSEQTVHDLIAERARQTPDAVAVIVGEQQLSYVQLDRQANRLAQTLIARGVGPEVLVAIALERSVEMLVGLLAILKAGGAFVPLDPEYPQERLAYMLRDSGVALLLTQTRLLGSLPVVEGIETLLLDQLRDVPGDDREPRVALHAGNLAYVIYTSGSTGQPKGVSVAHGPLAMHCLATGQCYEMSAADCELHFLSFAFDGAHERWLTTLIHGGRLLLRDDELWGPERTYEEIRRHGVTMAGFPPVYLQQLAEHAQRVGNPPPVRLYSFGGDAMPQASFELVQQALRPQVMINGYGPTETVVTPMVWKTRAAERCTSAYAPIGECVGERRACVLDAGLGLLPPGLSGELYLGGEGVARGYLNRAAMTAERFVPDPFSAHGARLYRSGDLVCQRLDGVFDYLGRIDNQVKIRGFRVELGEIEARLRALEGVREAAVLAKEGPSGKQLVAYIVSREAVAGSEASLRETLKARLGENLPDYMVPVHWLFLEQLPVTANGKLDRQALPAPDASLLQQDYSAPQNALEQQLVTIWQEVLKLERVGTRDNFFELGGDSIVSMQVVSRARQKGIHFTPKDLFQHQTVQSLAAVATCGDSVIRIDQGPVSGTLALLPVQQLFFAEAIPERHQWNQSVQLQTRLSLDAGLLEQALRALTHHHDALRLAFVEDAQGWSASYRTPAQADAQTLLWSVRASEVADLPALYEQAQRSLDLSAGPLLRAVLVDGEDGSHRLLLVIHHLVVDGVSWRVLLEDLQSVYQQLSLGQAIALPAKTVSGQAWAESLRRYAQSEAVQDQLGYWQAQLEGSMALPRDRLSDDRRNRQGQTLYSRLDKAATRRLLQEAPAAYRTQVNDLLLTALVRVIGRWARQDSVSVLLEGHGREELGEGLDLTRTLGWLTSLFPVKLAASNAIAESIKQVKEQLRGIPDKGMGYGALRYLAGHNALANLALPKITFNYLGQLDSGFADADEALFLPVGGAVGAEQSLDAPLGNWLTLNGQVFGGELSIGWTFSRAMFDAATIQGLVDAYTQELGQLIEHCCTAGHHGVTPSDFPLAGLSQAQLDGLPLAPEQIEHLYPLTPMQHGMLFHAVHEPQVGDYVNQLRVDVEGLDVGRFQQAWQAAVDAHGVLRTALLWQGDLAQPLQAVRKHMRLPFSEFDWREREAQEVALEQLALSERAQCLGVDQAPLIRLVAVRLADNRHHLMCTNHHILLDGWSGSRLLSEILQRYQGSPPARQSSRYGAFIEWQQRQDHRTAEAFWDEQLARLERPTRLVEGCEVNVAAGERSHHDHYVTLDATRTEGLKAFARHGKVTVNTLVQSAWLLLLQHYTGQATVAVGTTVAGRPAQLPGIEQELGLFINTLPLIATPEPQHSLGHWISEVQQQNLVARQHEQVPLYRLQRMAGKAGRQLFDTVMIFENYPVSDVLKQKGKGELSFAEVVFHEQTNYPLTLYVTLGEVLVLNFSYKQMFASTVIATLGEQLAWLLGQMVDSGEAVALGDLQARLADRWGQAAARPSTEPLPVATAYRAPVTPLQKTLATLLRELLGIEDLGLDDDLFERGVDSISGLQLVVRARQRLGTGFTLSLADVFEQPTLGRLSACLEHARVCGPLERV
jgi:amino acid adenylation domain-containing protein/non-ribosomal peptide synthase protein (TIGR01720 family)